MANGWTPERQARPSKLIRQWQPWTKAGVKTPEGKAISSRNAYKGNPRAMMKQLRALLKEQGRLLDDF